MENRPLQKKGPGQFANIAPKRLSSHELVKMDYFAEGQTLPLVIQPGVGQINLETWLVNQRIQVEAELLKHGAILFRGFGVDSIEHFEKIVRLVDQDLLEYHERSTPRSEVSSKIYSSTEYPADMSIPFHNENSYSHSWPRRLWFFCVNPATRGGATPLADSRRVYQLIDAEVRRKFTQQQVMYVRNYGNGVDLTWQEVFQTKDKLAVERYCLQQNMSWEWKEEGRLTTKQVRQAVTTHPQTGETVWFNQAHLFHISSLPEVVQETLVDLFNKEELPRNAYYGDGTPIELPVLTEIREAFQSVAVQFPWETGDVVVIDNVLVAHAREPYEGPRKIVVAMA